MAPDTAETPDNSAQSFRYGEWGTPITAELVAAGGVGLGGAAGYQNKRIWSELRPTEAGRVVLVALDTETGVAIDLLPAPWSARTRVHEYGGGAWTLGKQHLYFSNWDDQRLYSLDLASVTVDGVTGATPTALTPEPESKHGWRFADARETPDSNWLVCVREDHTTQSKEPVNEIVAVATDGSQTVVVLASGTDFVAAPRVSPDGKLLSWFRWNHPNMPWDGTELCVAALLTQQSLSSSELSGAELSRGPSGIEAGEPKTVAGSSVPGADEAIHGSDWLSTGELVFSTDRSGYWNLHAWDPATGEERKLSSLEGSEIGAPAWVFGTQAWTELQAGQLAVSVTAGARDSIGLLGVGIDAGVAVVGSDPTNTEVQILDIQVASVGSLAASANGTIIALVGKPDELMSIIEIDPATAEVQVLRPPADLGVDSQWFSRAETFDFESAGGRQSHAFFYPPTGAGVIGVDDELPPLIVMGHGGPTAHSSPDLSLKVQYWTSHGFAVLDVNYGGSTGFGRDYRRLLNDSWGLVDVEDCVAGAEQLAAAGRVDGERMAIRGGSAGGFTVLRALEVSDAFSAGTSLYGVADLAALAADTHKFEARYLDGLIGPYPEAKTIYDERSPINHTEDLSCPLLVMQGSEDEVVPPSQSEAIVAAVAAKGLPHAYLLFEGEQHGFRQSDTIVRSLEAELWFYGKVFCFTPAEPIADLPGAVGFD